MGRSALTLGMALADADNGRPTLVHSLEMSKAEVNDRIVAARSRRGTALPHERWSGHRGRRLTAHAAGDAGPAPQRNTDQEDQAGHRRPGPANRTAPEFRRTDPEAVVSG